MSVWQVQEAKSRFSEVLDRAKTEGPQTITKHGMETAVVMSMEEYRRLAGPKKDLIDLLLGGPKDVVLKQGASPALAEEFAAWLLAIEQDFDGRTLPVTAEIAHRWGEMSSDRTRPVTDTLIAATASVHDLTVVTRNERDYRDLGVRVINPWR